MKVTEKLAIDGGTPVRTEPLPWELPGSHWIGQEEQELVAKVIKARSPFRYYGPDPQGMADRLEDAFAKRLNRTHALAVGSGTAALSVAIGALGIGPGDEVLISGYMWVACLAAIVNAGAIPRLVDIDDTFCMSPQDLKFKIGPRSKAVLLTHMSGAPGHVDQIVQIAHQAGLKVIEDCAQANGARFKGKFTGSFGDIAIFSFQLNKNMTCGEGGLLLCDDNHLYKRCFAIHDLGYARNDEGRLDPTDERYQLWGIGSRISELSSAMALAQLGKVDKITAAMRKSKWTIRNAISDLPGIGFRNILDPDGDSGPFLITTYQTPEICRQFTDALRAEGIRGPEGSLVCITMKDWGLHWYFNVLSLVNRRSVSTSGSPWTHPANDFAKDYCYAHGELPIADDLHSRSALLAIASCLTEADVQDIITAFHKVSSNI